MIVYIQHPLNSRELLSRFRVEGFGFRFRVVGFRV